MRIIPPMRLGAAAGLLSTTTCSRMVVNEYLTKHLAKRERERFDDQVSSRLLIAQCSQEIVFFDQNVLSK